MVEGGRLLTYTRATVSLSLCAGLSEATLAYMEFVGVFGGIPHMSTLPLAQHPVL